MAGEEQLVEVGGRTLRLRNLDKVLYPSTGTTWVEPRVVVDVRHLGRTENGRLRQPVFRGIRADLEPEDVRYE